MSDYFWPAVITLLLTAAAGLRFEICRRARGRAFRAAARVQEVLLRRRSAAEDLVAAMRIFRPRHGEALDELDRNLGAVRDGDRRAPLDRTEAELRFTRALRRLPALVEGDVLLRIHAGCRKAIEALRQVEAELAAAESDFRRDRAAFDAQAAVFPNSLVIHVLDLETPEIPDHGLGNLVVEARDPSAGAAA